MIETRVAGQRVDRLSVDDVKSWSASKGLLWIDASPADSDDISYLKEALRLHPLVTEDLENRNQRPSGDAGRRRDRQRDLPAQARPQRAAPGAWPRARPPAEPVRAAHGAAGRRDAALSPRRVRPRGAHGGTGRLVP